MPAKAGISTLGSRDSHRQRGVLDHPPSRMMTSTVLAA
jgi:hypothetical protein